MKYCLTKDPLSFKINYKLHLFVSLPLLRNVKWLLLVIFDLLMGSWTVFAFFEAEPLLYLFALFIWVRAELSIKIVDLCEWLDWGCWGSSWSRLKVVYEMYFMIGLDYLILMLLEHTLLIGLSIILGSDSSYSSSSFIFLRFKCAVSLSITTLI